MILLVLQVPRGRRAMLGCQDLLALKVQKALKEKEVNQANRKCCCPHKIPQNY